MGILLANKVISPQTIQCNELAQVTLTLTAAPDITSNPVDIMLVLDRSGSMDGAPLTALKAAAIDFIDIIRESTNPGNPGATTIGSPSRIGIVSFADTASLNVPLTNDVATLNAAINALVAGGLTNHQAAFDLAAASYSNPPDPVPPNAKILIMFTDGDTTTGGDPNVAAANARAAGIEIYAIGLGNNIAVANLNNWATDPDNTHVLVAPTPDDLEQAFEDLAANIATPGAIDIEVVDTVEDEFEIVGPPILVSPPTTTAAAIIDPTNRIITWTLDQLGVTTTESATLTFNVRYLNCISATLPVNESIVYTDQSDPPNQVTFTPNITDIVVDCDADVTPDCCEPPEDVTFDECQTVIELDLPSPTGYYDLKCNGRLLALGIRLRNICPDRRVAVGVIATEVVNDVEYSRGFKAVTVPAQPASLTCPCSGVIVKPITFVFPEDLDDTPDICDERTFRIRVLAHYIDIGLTNFDICPAVVL